MMTPTLDPACPSASVADREPPAIDDLINTQIYPLVPLAGAAGQKLVDHGRAQMARSGVCLLPGFLRPEAIASMVKEAERLAPLAFHSTVEGNAYLTPADPELPPNHVMNRQEPTALAALAYDQMPAGSLLRRLYENDDLMTFIAALLGKERLYRYGDPMGALNIAVMRHGDYLRWHFDQTDFVVSLALQEATLGGDFEYVPDIRSGTAENFAEVAAVLDGDRSRVMRLPVTPGALILFAGRYALHRVTPIQGERARLMALLGYDTRPGVMSTPHLRQMRYGRALSYQDLAL